MRKHTEEERRARRKIIHKAWWERNKGKAREYQRNWRASHPEQDKETQYRHRGTAGGVFSTLRRRLLVREQMDRLLISRKEFICWWEKEPKICHYCGRLVERGISSNGMTIDRKDNSQGYRLGNMVIACKRCNTVKSEWLTYGQMLDIAPKYFNTD